MGQKVNPHGLRVGIIKDWDSKWYAGKKDFGDQLVEDYNIRKFVKKTCFDAGIAKIGIERKQKKVFITIHAAKPGLIIGRGGAEIDKLKSEIEKMTDKNISFNAIGGPCTSYELVAHDQTEVAFCGEDLETLKKIKAIMQTDYYHISVTTDVIGIEGSTGCSTGSHCHYCVRTSMSPGTALDVCAISGIPNNEWGIYDDGYRSQAKTTTPAPDIRALQLALNTEGCMLDADGICGPKTLAAARKQHIYNGASGEVVRWVQNYLNSIGYTCGIADGIAGRNTMSGVNAWQKAQGVGVDEMYGSDWDVLLA